jgi:hypothetical protein
MDIVIFFSKIGILAPQNPDISKPKNLRTSSQHCPVMMSQGKSGGHVDIPSAGVVRNKAFNLGQQQHC